MVTYGRTRLQIETAVGHALGVVFVGSWTAVSSTTTNTDTKWKGGADDANGMWLHATSGGETGEIVRVTDDDGSGVFIHDALTGTPSVGETYILWEEAFRPETIHKLMDLATMEVAGRFYDPEEDITLHGDGRQTRFAIPTSFQMLKRLEYRSSYSRIIVHDASSAWTAGTNVTVTADTELKKQGSASNKLAIGAVAAGAVIASKDFTADNFSHMTHVEWWARASFTTTAADYKLLLDDTSACVSPISTMNFPILTADTWTFIRVALAKADELTAILSVGVEDDVGNNDNQTLWIDHVQAVNDSEDVWTRVPQNLWSVDKEASEIVLSYTARNMIGYNLIKLTGGDKPALMTADTSITEVPERYMIAKTASLAATQASTEPNDKMATLAGYWESRANRAYNSLPSLNGLRGVA